MHRRHDQNKTGADILTGGNTTGQTASGSTGAGIFLRTTVNPSFDRMQLNDFTNFAVYGNSVTGFSLTNSRAHRYERLEQRRES